MTDTIPQAPVLRHLDMQAEMFGKLSAFQESLSLTAPVAPTLGAVLAAAVPAFEAGFAYTASFFGEELTVTLHHGGAELGSSAPASLSSYSDTCARLLAGLLGIPLADADGASEPEVKKAEAEAEAAEPAADEAIDTAPAAVEAAADVEEADEEFDDGLDQASAEQPATPDVKRELTEEERTTAIGMIKAMEVGQRKAFTKAFRELFQVPADAKQISPHITLLEHWLFIDRYTVEAAGGVAA